MPERFQGVTFDPALDESRLERQLGRVYEFLAPGEWRTLGEIAAAAGGSEAGVSARLRDLRKPEFGGYTVERRRRHPYPSDGLWEYRMLAPRRAGPDGQIPLFIKQEVS